MGIDPARKLAWLHEFRMNGFVVLRNFLPPDFVVQLHEDLKPLLEIEYRKESESGWSRGRAPFRLALDVARFAGLVRGALADDLFQRNPQIEELVDAILGSWRRGWTQVEVPWKGSGHMAWHTDLKPNEVPNPAGHHEVVRVTYNIPLVDFTWSNGAIELLPGSHLLPHGFWDGKDIRTIQVYPIRPELRRGDALLRDSATLHRGTPNLEDVPRPMLDQTYKKNLS
ncbi:MAG TPA: phytanoyl-CoA dioxygenase family protein [Candidatus Polarisedimenticolia bacterium]|nr:phytanoyl-CoA dioxygenase family protein [Candidatus Polarisedimenticolia bacterium]